MSGVPWRSLIRMKHHLVKSVKRLQQKSLSSLYRDDLCFLFHYLHCLTESRQKSRVLCAVFVLFFLFYAVFIEHQINTILYGKPNVGSYTGFAESKLPNYENLRFCLCGGKKKRWPNFKIPVIYEVWQMPLKIHHLV